MTQTRGMARIDPDMLEDDLFGDMGTKSERGARLKAVAPNKGNKLRYLYDFGDSWDHDLLVEEVPPPVRGTRYPLCLAGRRACPPEDCGGVWGYQELLAILANPAQPDTRNGSR